MITFIQQFYGLRHFLFDAHIHGFYVVTPCGAPACIWVCNWMIYSNVRSANCKTGRFTMVPTHLNLLLFTLILKSTQLGLNPLATFTNCQSPNSSKNGLGGGVVYISDWMCSSRLLTFMTASPLSCFTRAGPMSL